MNVKDFIQSVRNSESYKLFEEEGGATGVGNVTGNIDGYNTPHAFSKDEDENREKTLAALDSSGFSVLPKKQKRRNFKTESQYKSMMDSMHEVSYRSFKTDGSRTTGQKINGSIKNIDGALREIERIVNHAIKYKTEMAIDQRNLWKSSKGRLVQIADKLIRIGKKINELGS